MANPDRKSKEERASEEPKSSKGTLYIVSTPIGNDEDISLRALRVLKNSDVVICEEPKVGARMLHKLNLHQRMELLNEQNEEERTPELIEMLEAGMKLCLVSDAGTPLFADPGYLLVRAAIKKNIYVSVVPGASSIMTALVRSTFNIQRFYYAGFLSRKSEERYEELKRFKNIASTVVLLETPYRIMPVLQVAAELMSDRKAYIGCNLTMPYETHHYGTFKELLEKFSDMKFKGEFIICFEGAGSSGADDFKYVREKRYGDSRKYSGNRGSSYSRSGGGRSYSRDNRRSGSGGGRSYSRDDRRSGSGGGRSYSGDKKRSYSSDNRNNRKNYSDKKPRSNKR